MEKIEKHTLEIGDMLAQWLNTAQGLPAGPDHSQSAANPACEEVCGLIEKLRGLEGTLKAHPIAAVPKRGPSRYLFASPGALLRDSINTVLGEYQFVPTLNVVGKREVRLGWIPATSESEQRKTLGKASMIQVLCTLADDGALSRLRHCASSDCGRWFMADRGNKEFCSVKCRRRHQGTSEAFKAHRREYMRDNYRLQKSGKVR
ncbi:MAG: hypothetical protein WA700_18205 [Acidobacteriaceae bacterium]